MSIVIDEARAAVERASKMVAEALDLAPGLGVYLHAKSQLEAMREIMAEPSRWTESRAFVDIGLMAARELLDEEPELADALMRAAHRFQRF